MNIKRWVAGRQAVWQRLEEVLNQIEREGLPSLTKEQLLSLPRLYKGVASDLSRARAVEAGSDITLHLNNLVVRGHNQVYQNPQNRWKDLKHFLWITFPAVFRDNIIYVFISFLFFAGPMFGSWWLVVQDVNMAHNELIAGQPLVADELFAFIEQHKMWTDVVQDYSPVVSSFIVANNIKIAIMAFVCGITCGVGTVLILVVNGMSLGGVFAVCQIHGMNQQLAAFVAPHGIFELSAIFISGGAGLLVAKSMLFPGQYSRADALRLAAVPAFIMFAGCISFLLIAGVIEGFISPRTDIPQNTKYLISLTTFVILLLYLFLPRKTTN